MYYIQYYIKYIVLILHQLLYNIAGRVVKPVLPPSFFFLPSDSHGAFSFSSVVKKFKNFKKKNEGFPQPSLTPSPHPSAPSLAPAESQRDEISIQISPEEAAPGNDAAPYDGEGSQSDDDDAANGEYDAKSDNDAADYDDDDAAYSDDDALVYNDRSPVYDKYDADDEEAAVAEAIAAAAAAALEAAVADMPLDKIAPAFTRSTSAPNLRHRPPGGGDPDDPNASDPR